VPLEKVQGTIGLAFGEVNRYLIGISSLAFSLLRTGVLQPELVWRPGGVDARKRMIGLPSAVYI
jgi:hypothetical protein